MSLLVSVIVPTYRRPDLLRGCLDALLKQDFPAGEYEIIVADNAGSEETRALVEAIGQDSKGAAGHACVRYLAAADKPGPAAARNAGWRVAQGEVMAFTDDDCVPQPNWISAGLKALREGFDGVSGRVRVPVPGVPTDYEKNTARLERAEFLTANCFIRSRALAASGGFDERFTTAWREDSDLHFKMLSASFKLGTASAALVVHPIRKYGWGVSVREQRKSMFNALLFKKYPRLYRERIQPSPPWRYYAIVACMLATPLVALTRNWLITTAVAAAWVELTAWLAFDRLEGTRHDLSHVVEMLATSVLIPPLSVFWRLYGALKFRVWFL